MKELLIVSLSLLALCFLIGGVHRWLLRRVTIYEYERGLRYIRGRFDRVLEPGVYWYAPLGTRIDTVDTRPRYASINGQEILTADGVSLKLSLAARYEPVELNVAINQDQDYQATLYLELQLALREIVGSATADHVLEAREELASQLLEKSVDKASALGLKLHEVNIKDIMFPGPLKQTFAQVAQARKEGQAALERARGETAALRNLANAARLMESNPALMQLRLLHSMAGSDGNTLVLGLPPESFKLASNGNGNGAKKAGTTAATTSKAKKKSAKKKK